MSKVCTKCKQEKPLSEFGKSKNTGDRYTYKCLQCKCEYASGYRLTTKGVYNSLVGRMNFYHTKPVLISYEDFEDWWENTPRKCVYCGISEKDVRNVDDPFNNQNGRLTIDCVDNYVGYKKGNIVLACRRCNNMKSDLLNFEQMRYVGQNFIKPIWEKRLNKKII